MRLVAFCEAAADFRIASDLIDRVLRHAGPRWVADALDTAPEGVRSWRDDGHQHPFFVIHDLAAYVDQHAARVPHGHFDGRSGAADALMARTAFSLVRTLVNRGDDIAAAVLIRNLDDRPDRRDGIAQASAEASSLVSFSIVVGCADPKREAWVLCGFDPETDDEHASLRDLRQELGFQPTVHAHQLDAKDDRAKRSAKRVLRALVGGTRTARHAAGARRRSTPCVHEARRPGFATFWTKSNGTSCRC